MATTAMNTGKIAFRSVLGAIVLGLVLSTLQILFEIPVAPFLAPKVTTQGALHTAQWSDGAQTATGKIGKDTYPSLIVQRGVPVEFTLTAAPGVLNDCNEKLRFAEFDIEQLLVPGDNVLHFTPEESGVFAFSCWMDTIKGSVTVVESLGFPSGDSPNAPDTPDAPAASDVTPEASNTSPAEESAAQTEQSETPVEAPTEAPRKPTMPGMRGQFIPPPQIDSEPVFEKPDDDASLGGWLEDRLVPDENTAGSKEIRTWTGWMFDRDCVGISPVKHTKMCNLMGSCYDSGLGMFEYVPGKAFDSYTAIDTFQTFDGASKELAAAFLYALPADWKNNVTITVSGYAVNNIPAADDELLIPETDLSRVTHYLNGIHITEIRAAFIDGISTYTLPEPNIAFTQP
jgi:hypothetical protein